MLCARHCPDWCIYIEGHKEKRPPRREGGRERTVSVLDRFDIDYALCMYCGICVEVCPFDALFWSPEYEYSECEHRQAAARQAEARRVDGDGPRARAARDRRRGQEEVVAMCAQNVAFWILAVAMAVAAIGVVRSQNVVHAALYLVVVLAGAPRSTSCSPPSSSPGCRCSSTSAPSSSCSCSASCSPARRCAPERELDNNQRLAAAVVALFLFGVITALLVDAFGGKEIKLNDDLVLIGSTSNIALEHLPRLPGARSRSCRCCSSPRSSAPS